MYENTSPVTIGRVLPSWRTATARFILIVAALGAAFSVNIGIAQTMEAGTATQAIEAWRTVGFAVFTGLFLLLAWRPHNYPGVLEIAIASKAILAVLGLTILAGADGAFEFVVFDGILAIALMAAYFLVEGWTAWQTAR